GLVVGCPDEGADPGELVGQQRAATEVFDAERVLPEAGGVAAVGQQAAVVANDSARHVVEFVPPGEFVDVEQDLLVAVEAAPLAAMDRVLLTFLRSRKVPVIPLADRYAQVGLLDAGQELLVEPVLERPGWLHDRLGVGVLGLEVLDDLEVLLLPQPVVVVEERCAVKPGEPGDLLGDRRSGPAWLGLRRDGQGEKAYVDWTKPKMATHDGTSSGTRGN